MKPPYERIVLEKRESRTVAALRDALLRKLLSEELRMRTAEKLLEVE
ncbi:Type I restriction-modification system specificity determinant (fragment) [Candidatus Methylomirabilis oxygeniifera]|uniref:Type I restriction-modification system specificity determinant n=2 Tax=Candidatus Methylomirabilis TaxID=1170227 RepID=D5MJ79_METO1